MLGSKADAMGSDSWEQDTLQFNQYVCHSLLILPDWWQTLTLAQPAVLQRTRTPLACPL